MSTIAVAILSIILSVAAQFSLKAGMSDAQVKEALRQPLSPHVAVSVLTDKFVLGGFLLYALGALVWLAVLSKWDVSKAYPLVGLGFVFTVGLGVMTGEQVTVTRALGVALIAVGVFVVSQS